MKPDPYSNDYRVVLSYYATSSSSLGMNESS